MASWTEREWLIYTCCGCARYKTIVIGIITSGDTAMTHALANQPTSLAGIINSSSSNCKTTTISATTALQWTTLKGPPGPVTASTQKSAIRRANMAQNRSLFRETKSNTFLFYPTELISVQFLFQFFPLRQFKFQFQFQFLVLIYIPVRVFQSFSEFPCLFLPLTIHCRRTPAHML